LVFLQIMLNSDEHLNPCNFFPKKKEGYFGIFDRINGKF
jgi:hypothetical protein